MTSLKIAVAQFQPRNGDKQYNLSVMEKLIARARAQGVQVISFHELAVTAYTFLKDLNRAQLLELAEEIPAGPSVQQLCRLSDQSGLAVLAGLLEKDRDKLYNTYICAEQGQVVAKFRKLHPFISPYLNAGEGYTVFPLKGWQCGILICYDNNVIENVRATTLLGAELIFAPHVTGCTPSAMPGRGYVADVLWENRATDPVPLRQEFDGPKGRAWLLRWLPARAYDNGLYYAFSNPIGYDGSHLKNGNAMILDPYGEILSETRSFDDEIAVATLTKDKLTLAGGYRYRNARRPELYRDILGREHRSETRPVWLK